MTGCLDSDSLEDSSFLYRGLATTKVFGLVVCLSAMSLVGRYEDSNEVFSEGEEFSDKGLREIQLSTRHKKSKSRFTKGFSLLFISEKQCPCHH